MKKYHKFRALQLIAPGHAGAVFALAIALLLCVGFDASAEKAYVLDVVRDKPYNRIIVSASIKGAFTQEIIQTLESGAPVTFTYFIELNKLRSVIWDETSKEIVIKRMVKYDHISKEYIGWEKSGEDEDEIDFETELAVMEHKRENNLDNEQENDTRKKKGELTQTTPLKEPEPVSTLEPDVFKSLDQLNQWMSHLEKVDMGPVDGLTPMEPYYAQVKCEMKTIKLATPFNYILFFVALWNVDTDWAESSHFDIDGVTKENKKIQGESAPSE